jgi:hypothetical protein
LVMTANTVVPPGKVMPTSVFTPPLVNAATWPLN